MLATKTAIIYRPFLWLEVKQDIDTHLYNANDILTAYNSQVWNDKKDMQTYLRTYSTKEYIDELETLKANWAMVGLLDRNSNSVVTTELNYQQEQATINTKVKWIIETKKWKFWWTWMCDHLLVDFMMWLSPKFKYQAIDFILNGHQLCLWRNRIRQWYVIMCKAIADSGNANYREEATMLNSLVTWSEVSWQRCRFWLDDQDMMDRVQQANWALIAAWLDIGVRKNLLIKQFCKEKTSID